MNKIKLLLITVLKTILFTIIALSANGQDLIIDLNSCFQNGKVEEISPHLSSNIDLGFDQQKSVYSKSQTIVLLKQFIEREPASYYKLVKSSEIKSNTKIFFIAEYKTQTKDYLIYMSLKKENQKYLITEILFELQ